jgi:hypothetical protein
MVAVDLETIDFEAARAFQMKAAMGRQVHTG